LEWEKERQEDNFSWRSESWSILLEFYSVEVDIPIDYDIETSSSREWNAMMITIG
jgi:hypothetical protein